MSKTSLSFFFTAVEEKDYDSIIKHGGDVLDWISRGQTYHGHFSTGLIPLVESAIHAAEESKKADKKKFDLIEEIVNFKGNV